MSMTLSQTISQKQVLQQRLILTQELQLFLKLIQMTTVELNDYLEEQLIENPTLEESEEQTDSKDESSDDDPFDLKDLGNDRLLNTQASDVPHYTSREHFDDSEDTTWENRVSATESLLDHLRWQLNVSDFSEEEKKIASIIIGNTNEDGYLEIGIEDTALQHMRERYGCEPKLEQVGPDVKLSEIDSNGISIYDDCLDKAKYVLKDIQESFDPTSVCARNLQECLRIQALDMGHLEDNLVIRIIDNHLEDLENKEMSEISAELGVSENELKSAMSVVSSLEPRPGRPFYQKDTEKYIVPDFFVYKVGNDLQVQLNKDFPKVRISNYYRTLIKKEKTLPPETKQYIREKLEAARRIMKCLDEREAAVKKIISKIVEVQRDFFEHGRKYIKPLILKDVAQSVGVHESTVSRITSRRYIQTPQGTIELKSLFSRKIQTSHGTDISFEKVKSIIQDIIKHELPASPYSDEDISKILARRSVIVARRTVAKYRKILKIPSSSARSSKKKGSEK